MANKLKLTGQKMIDFLPANCLDRIKESFRDFGLDYDQDVMDCTVILDQTKGSCFLKHNRIDEFEKGTLLACFNQDGSGFYYAHPSRTKDNEKLIAEAKRRDQEKF